MRDRQAKAGSAKAPRGAGLSLSETCKDAFLGLGRDADSGISHGKPKGQALIRR